MVKSVNRQLFKIKILLNPIFMASLLAVACLVLSAVLVNTSRASTNLPEKYALKISSLCAGSKDISTCHVDEFAKISQTQDLPKTLETLSAFQKLENTPSGCHFIGHVIAHEAVAKSPSDWQKVIEQIPIEACSGGFLMGLLEARMNFETNFTMEPTSIEATCRALKTANSDSREKTCFHTMGHLSIVERRGDINKALAICSAFEPTLGYECSSGVFMENLYRRNLEAHSVGKQLIWSEQELKKQELICYKHTKIAARACWRELSHMYLVLENSNMAEVLSGCARSGMEELTNICYIHAVGIETLTRQKNSGDLNSMCEPLAANTKSHNDCLSMIQASLAKNDVEH